MALSVETYLNTTKHTTYKNHMFTLPVSILSTIYTYDDTYLAYLRNHVHKEFWKVIWSKWVQDFTNLLQHDRRFKTIPHYIYTNCFLQPELDNVYPCHITLTTPHYHHSTDITYTDSVFSVMITGPRFPNPLAFRIVWNDFKSGLHGTLISFYRTSDGYYIKLANDDDGYLFQNRLFI